MTSNRKYEKRGDWVNKGNDFKPDNPLWDKWENEKTGEHSQKVINPEIIMDSSNCNHNYKPLDKRGDVQCATCGIGTKIIFPYELIDGKIQKMKLNVAS